MVKEFLDFINTNKLCGATDQILVTVSGGVDSVVLATLFKEAGYTFSIAHCNFQLRGQESDNDEKFVKKLAEFMNAPFYSKSFNTKNYAAEKGISIEMAARELRYEWFYQLIDEHHLDRIATGHHLNDSLETSIYNLTKGTGISGLRGISFINNKVIRPLLFLTRQQILDFALEKKLGWRVDSSNASMAYHRNRIRNRVIPELININPALVKTFKQTQKKLLETEAFVKDYAEWLSVKYLKKKRDDIFIDFKILSEVKQTVILENILKPYGFNYSQAEEIHRNMLLKESGKLFLSESYCLNIDRNHVIISPKSYPVTTSLIYEGDESHTENKWFRLHCFLSQDNQRIKTGRKEASLDYDRLAFPLTIRKWKEGDTFQPLGMGGKKKLSDFMIDEKIPLNLKERVYVLESGGEIVWVIGHRVDERFKVTRATRKMYNIVMTANDQSV